MQLSQVHCLQNQYLELHYLYVVSSFLSEYAADAPGNKFKSKGGTLTFWVEI